MARAGRLAAPLRLDAGALARIRALNHPPQRGEGVLAVARLDQLAPDPPGPGLGGAVAADVDARPHPGAAQLRARGHLLDRLEAPHVQVDGATARAGRERAGARLQQLERRGERLGIVLVDLRAVAHDHAVAHRPASASSADTFSQRAISQPSWREKRPWTCSRCSVPEIVAVCGPPNSSVQATSSGVGSKSAGRSLSAAAHGPPLPPDPPSQEIRACFAFSGPSPSGSTRTVSCVAGAAVAEPEPSPASSSPPQPASASASAVRQHNSIRGAITTTLRTTTVRRHSLAQPAAASGARCATTSACPSISTPPSSSSTVPCQETARRWPSADGSRWPKPSEPPATSWS